MNKIFIDLSYQLKCKLPVEIVNSLKSNNFYQILHTWRLKTRKSLSQAGQDYWVINEVFAGKKQGYFVEIGSADGIQINNTYLLEKCYDWSGICIEANPDSFKQLQLNRNCLCLNLCVDEKEGEVDFFCNNLSGGIFDIDTDVAKRKDVSSEKITRLKTTTLANILEQYQAPQTIDYLSIDVEGAETRILQKFPFDKYIFSCITIERPSITLNDILVKNGYILIKIIPELDSFYIHESLKKIYLQNQIDLYNSLRS